MRKKIILLTISTAMIFSLCACGKSTNYSATSTDATVTDATQTNTVTNPDNMRYNFGYFDFEAPLSDTFERGDALDDTDERYCTIRTDANHYIEFSYEDSHTCMSKYEKRKEMFSKNQTIIKASYGKYNWTGFQYTTDTGDVGFEAYVESPEGVTARLSSVGYTFDSQYVQLVLSGLNIHSEAFEEVEVIRSTEDIPVEVATSTDSTDSTDTTSMEETTETTEETTESTTEEK